MDETLRGIAESLRGLSMPELRKDPIVGRWVIIATDRAKRPVTPRHEPMPPTALCPFCEGHEEHTPHEIVAYRRPGTKAEEPGWRVRVVRNQLQPLEEAGQLQHASDVLIA